MTHQTFQLMTSVIFPREVRLLHQHRKRIQFCHIRSVPLGRLLINSRISLGTLKILVHMLPIMLRSYKILQDRKVLSYLYRFLKEILELKEFLVLSFQEFKASLGIQWSSMKKHRKHIINGTPLYLLLFGFQVNHYRSQHCFWLNSRFPGLKKFVSSKPRTLDRLKITAWPFLVSRVIELQKY